MTKLSKIKELLSKLPKNEWLELSDIHNFISTNISLDDGDLSPINDSNNYPKWKRTIHGALSNYKSNGIVDHIPKVPAKRSNSGKAEEPKYMFLK
ncbi:hypothetical protein [Konateibacter massiliensis]|uniref:hypothetical protein n=1 Tax=Konateibacter massiliensis TaxID=2002841 RepID=UPI000C15CE52|nr:hypothetical protein [Konateibacter massiliensis]